MREDHKAACRPGGYYQFERLAVRVNRYAIMHLQFFSYGVAQLVYTLKEAVMIKPGGYHFIDGAHKLRVKSDLVLTLHEISARWNDTRYCANIRLYPLCFLQVVSPELL
jgi:hypothetical protein